MLSFHTSPLLQPGQGDAGGMNVYVRELVSALAQGGVECTTYTRRMDPAQPDVVEVEPGHRVVHIDAGDSATCTIHQGWVVPSQRLKLPVSSIERPSTRAAIAAAASAGSIAAFAPPMSVFR